MTDVSIRDLRNHGGEVVDRVAAGEAVVITRGGTPVAELRPIGRPTLTAEQLQARWKTLPRVDFDQFRRDLDEVLDPWL